MSVFEVKIPPVRDERLSIGDSFAGRSCDVLNCASSGCMLQKGRRFWQANMCQMSLSIMMAVTVENSVIIEHAPLGCGSILHALGISAAAGKMRRGKQPGSTIWLSTNLQESDVIGGGEQRLHDTILYADREFHPEIIFVVSTCAPNIIGDDVEEVVRAVGAGTEAQVTSLHCPGFKSRVVASAYDAFYHSLLSHIRLEPIPYKDYQPVELSDPDYGLKMRQFNAKKQMTVNLFNATSIGPDDEIELTRLLNAIGIDVRIFAEYCSADELRMVSFAGLNVSMCNVHDDYILKFLLEKYNIPYIICGMPIGIAGTRAWLLEIADHYGLTDKAMSLLDSEEEQLRASLAPLLPQIQGKRVVLDGGVIRSGAEALMLKELGVEVIGVNAFHYDNNADPVLFDLAEALPDVPFAISNQSFELINQLKKLKPDLAISHNGTHGALARAGITSMQLFDVNNPFFAFNGIYRFVRKMIFALRNTSYQDRLSLYAELPYKEDWYSKDPFFYVTD
jgi:nitrogenase molybdenum-iron protein alpha chain